jgi:hypothetical protein
MSEQSKIIYKCFGLLNSMIACGENHSEQSRQLVNDARQAVEELEAEKSELTAVIAKELNDLISDTVNGKKLAAVENWIERSLEKVEEK